MLSVRNDGCCGRYDSCEQTDQFQKLTGELDSLSVADLIISILVAVAQAAVLCVMVSTPRGSKEGEEGVPPSLLLLGFLAFLKKYHRL